ncbi:MAG TPA: tetratricopeptide repeat protein [Candidatus Acidoferrum sp.]|nr:tetratricopeptide repeat protein [Candidatus Acidoferrum sp.]
MRNKLILALVVGILSCGTALAQKRESDRLIDFYKLRVVGDPEEYANYDHLGSAYLQKARETGDPVYYELSEKGYKQALELLDKEKPEAAGTIAHLAALYLSVHRFEESLALANKALALDPQLLSTYATLGDSELETGRYDAAASSYSKMLLPADSLPPRPGLAYLSETRQASRCFIAGRPQEAVEHMRAAIARAMDAHLPKENIAWSQFSLGELYYGMGDFARAEASYQQALETYPGYHRALAWLGQLRAAQGRYSEAAELYRKALTIIPLPVYAAALGDIYTEMGQTEEAKKQYDLVDLIAKLNALNQQLFRRELASFYAEHNVHLREALELAQSELQQRQDVYTWDVLAWARFKNGDTTEAVEAVSHALAQGTKDPIFFFHAGMIFYRAGDYDKARAFLKLALAINPHFHIRYAAVAHRALTQLNSSPMPFGIPEESGDDL